MKIKYARYAFKNMLSTAYRVLIILYNYYVQQKLYKHIYRYRNLSIDNSSSQQYLDYLLMRDLFHLRKTLDIINS